MVVALQALSLSLLPLAAPSAALGPAIAVGTPGTEAPGEDITHLNIGDDNSYFVLSPQILRQP